jgi:lysyl-tRNA synthetase class 2
MINLQRLHTRAAFFRALRSFFNQHDFLEVDTPVRQPVLIPETNIQPPASEDWLLQASPELCMKRLLALGAGRIFQICPCFRRGERGRLHSEEFLMLEWYRREADYHQLMRDCEELIRTVSRSLPETDCFTGIDLSGRWPQLTVAEAFARFSPVPLERALEDDSFDEVLVEHIEPRLGLRQPSFLCDYPAEMASLARRSSADPRVAERFELYIRGVEVANGFSELADAQEQRQRFKQEIEQIEVQWGRRAAMPEQFLAALPAMGEAAGIALGVDRLLMLALNKTALGDVQTFSAEDL